MALSRREVQKGLSRKGFEKKEGANYTLYRFYTIKGERTGVQTFFSRGTSQTSLGSTLLASIARQCGLSKEDFLNLVDCTLSQGDYEAQLRKNGKIK